MKSTINELASFNTINVCAITVPLMDVESILTILVLCSVLVYNIKKIMSKND
tara:strand:+ start:8493 stop:8648 length:156 start_codon:yes stop_codon:yes gene_type:complete